MKNLLTYSGITTKIRAMQGGLINASGFRELSQLKQVSEAVAYLKQTKSYGGLFHNIDDSDFHRAAIEEVLSLSLYRDFTKLYRFANLKQRQFLSLYFTHYEIKILKACLRNILAQNSVYLDSPFFQEYFDYHSSLDIQKIASSISLEEFINHLEGSDYYEPLSHLKRSHSTNLFDYETQLDRIYFKQLWNNKKGFLTKAEQEILTKCFGSNLDLLNIQWIYRSKQYYHLNIKDIYSLLIPVSYRLNKNQLTKLVESTTLDDFFNLLKGTYYGSLIPSNLSETPDLEKLSEQVLNRVYRQTAQKAPYSIAILNSYLYFKEIEIKKIVTIIEGIRYGLSPDIINSYVIKI